MLLYHLLLLISTSFTTDAFRHVARPPGYLNAREVSINPNDYPAFRIDIPIDHYNASDTRTYKNRYWVNSKYYKPGGPVFYFDAGEQNAYVYFTWVCQLIQAFADTAYETKTSPRAVLLI